MLWKRIFSKPVISKLPKALKMVLVVRADLRLSKGKTASQCAHAAVMCYEQNHHHNRNDFLNAWKLLGQPKIVLRVDTGSELEEIAREARNQGIVTALIRDAGRTEVSAGTITVLGLGPDCQEKLNKITGKLKIL
ncbi:peptidyl-tRNA hydrolase 2 [Sergentomyia squamirostris]